MNDVRDCTLTPKLAETPSRRSVLRGIGGGLLAALGVQRVISAQKAEKVDICHYDAETDNFRVIRVNGNALNAHLDHGDHLAHPYHECGCSTQAGWIDAVENARWPGVAVKFGPYLAGDSLHIEASGTGGHAPHLTYGPDGSSPGNRWFSALVGSWTSGKTDSDVFYVGSDAHLVYPETGDGYIHLYFEDTDSFNNCGGFNVTATACAS